MAVDAAVKLSLDDAKILAGGTLGWKGAHVHARFGSEKSYASGWTPEFKPSFKAEGSIGVAIDIGLPFEISLGVKFLNTKMGTIGTVWGERPSIEIKGSIAGKIEAGNGPVQGEFGDEECKGIKTGIELKNDTAIKLRAGALTTKLTDVGKPLSKELKKGCIALIKKKIKRDFPLLGRQVTNGTVSGNSTEEEFFMSPDFLIDQTAVGNASDPLEEYNFPSQEISAYNRTDNLEFIGLLDFTQEYMATACGNGNMYLQIAQNEAVLDASGCGPLFACDWDSDTVLGDGSGRIAYFHSDVMEKVGVSRLRFASTAYFPAGAQYVSFVPYEAEEGWIYLPPDDAGNVYGTAVCTYKGPALPAKLFAINDPETAIEVLMSPDVKYSITGGDVEDCFSLPLREGDDEPDAAWSGVGEGDAWEDDWVEEWTEEDFFDLISGMTDEEFDAWLAEDW
ncbi:hypothetical protein P152DRAFT_308567 [Eremomyces bilateralis CBS 781.70]|uniref:Uncharacterized protein n=1 Tax=Eremomyces bilateralis CBS 781.70 TaxID=1392243 RepID=A0A6G1G5C2_9PEZI|nr:uncharacterized protein P152DRAFT_308567 [Eremomyces bilateralis CBS 781.70]KAF1813202.1 hypothetical protein P152DRAFT_308567 [Eremomyces bilateralis CBS 781.70]